MADDRAWARLTPERYLEVLHRDGERMIEAAHGVMDLPVPTCPGWTVDDVVFHVGGVYAHKLATLRLGHRPAQGEWSSPGDDATPQDDLDWCHAMLHALAAELAVRPAEEPAWTWWPAEPTVSFWQRRMAHETAVHRVDVEAAAGSVTPVPDDVAVDGIDEFLAVHLAAAGFTGTTSLAVDGAAIAVQVDDVTVCGTASDVLLWLWGRRADDAVAIDGAPAERARVRDRLREAAQ